MRTHLPLYTYLILNPILPCPTLLQLKHTLTLHILTTLLLLRPLAPTFALALAIPTPYNIQQQYPTPAHIPSPQAPSHYSSLQEVQDLSKIIAFEAWTNAISEKMSGYNYYRVGNVRGENLESFTILLILHPIPCHPYPPADLFKSQCFARFLSSPPPTPPLLPSYDVVFRVQLAVQQLYYVIACLFFFCLTY